MFAKRQKPAPSHDFGEGSYLVLGADRRGWGFRCTCGWRSSLYDSEAAAQEAMTQHLLHPSAEPNRRRRPA